MRVSELYPRESRKGLLEFEDVYIIGTGPSLRVFPVGYLKKKTCILLNTAHRILPECGPVAFSNHVDFLRGKPPVRPECTCPVQIVKGRLKYQDHPSPVRPDNHVPWNDPDYHVFSYREPFVSSKTETFRTGDEWSHFDERALWGEPDFYWNVRKGSVAIFAVQFALLAGARSITLVGCDCCEFHGTDGTAFPYASDQNAGPPNIIHNYGQYAAGLDRLAKEARIKFGVPLMHLSPFPGFGREQSQFIEFQTWGKNEWT